jgi:DNA repair protein RecO (recombination protein O)
MTVRGLVLRARDLKESDRLLTVLTDSMGKQIFLAKGARRKGSRIRSASQLLTYNEFSVFEYKNWMHVDEAETLEAFFCLRGDLDRLSVASYFCELLEAVTDSDSVDPEVLQLALNSVYALSDGSRDARIVKSGFELRIMCLAGYEPMIGSCSVCISGTPDFFSVQKGVACCSTCARQLGDNTLKPIDPAVHAAMHHIIESPVKKIFSFRMTEPSLKLLSNITEAYVISQLERSFDTLDFIKGLQI